MINFDFLEKGLKLVFLPHLVYEFWRKMFVILYSIKPPNILAWLPLLLDILGNVWIVIICFPVSDTIDFEISLSILIKTFTYMIKKSEQIFKYFQNDQSFFSSQKLSLRPKNVLFINV